MTDQMTDQMTNTEPARPDLEGMLISARACEDWTATVFTDFPIVCHYALRLESELAAMTADRDALIAAGIEETARADNAETAVPILLSLHRAAMTLMHRRAQKAESFAMKAVWEPGKMAFYNARISSWVGQWQRMLQRAGNAEAMLADFIAMHHEQRARADRAEKEAKELRDRIFPPVKSVVITAPMAPALSIQELCAPIAANLSPEQSVGGSESKE